jgi:cytochrome c
MSRGEPKGATAAALVLALLLPPHPAPAAGAPPPGDPAKGQGLFEERCTLCHQLDTPGQGPSLRGVVGRKSGALAGFPYTDAMKEAGLVWTPETLDTYLQGPRALVPGTAMIQTVPDAQDRADLIAFLAQQK